MAIVLTKKLLEFEGIPEIAAKVNKLLLSLREDGSSAPKIKKVYITGAMVTRNEARNLAPVRTGRLRSAIFAAYGDKSKPNVLVGVNYKMAPHAHWIEFGAAHNRPQHFMRDAITATRPLVARMISEGLLTVITEAAEQR